MVQPFRRLGELQAESLKLAKYNKNKIKSALEKIQVVSYEHSNSWMNDLQSICAQCGIALVYTPSIAKAPIYGASRWIKNNSIPLIQVSDRQKTNNAFWFTFYHELAHILKHGKKDVFLDGLKNISIDEQKELEADNFAHKKLLTIRERNELASYERFNVNLVLSLSQKFNRHPGIIVSQLQRENKVAFNNSALNRLKAKIKFDQIRI